MTATTAHVTVSAPTPKPTALQELGGKLRQGRLRVGLTQDQVAARIGLARPAALSEVEHGKRRVDCFELAALAALYGETLEHLLGIGPRPLSQTERLLARLETMTGDLAGYVEQRAREVAEPVMELAERTAARAVAVAEGERDRERDLVAELRLQLEAAHRRESALRHARPAAVQS